jgi:putative transposase
MSHSYTAIFFHCVFSTKERKHTIPFDLKPKLYAYTRGIAENLGVVLIAVGGTSNHVHLLLELRPHQTITEVVQKIKANSSRWMSEHGLSFEWQKGYAALTVSPSLVHNVRAYVQTRSNIIACGALTRSFSHCSRKLGFLRNCRVHLPPEVPSLAGTRLMCHSPSTHVLG